MSDPDRIPSALSRRSLVSGTVLGLGAALTFATPASAAPNYSKVPKLPGEIGRSDTVTSRFGKKKYEVIDVVISGDRTRLFVPHATPPSLTRGAGFLWYYHANGSSYAALSGAFQYTADQVVDQGMVCICPNYGGSVWTSETALQAQRNATAYVQKLWKVSVSFLRSNSGGGALLCYAYGKRMVPNIRGAYHASGVYDMEDVLLRRPESVLPAYGNDPAAVKATNPIYLPQSVWAKTRLRISGSPEDQVVPYEKHSARLYRRALPVAKEVSLLSHSGAGGQYGHVVPSQTNKDMLVTFQRWMTEGPA
ncbi:hypothetical protein C1I63_05325 [Rathayibacter caricis DSM 15933]|uniref:Alpha/beta hydrolase n=1 Tax=Rathayibacter caricis DSM 15933 TaxID=1328867 RepID=A0A2T4US21_9MICO|nr:MULTISPECIES: hypothetical protein [Rathayibacter]KQQ21789.1 hypothetical protein ASF48_00605 [Rathayibacter sp. Leaf299]MCJ1697120.1 hypothetical protein [Rathayibacter caricis]PTL72324.1 hypothetical protein C1I63_05325 [Rathayibacter caricis DSM 15933]